MSTAVRIPDEVHADVKAIAAMRGKVPGEVLAAAWREYLANHRDEVAEDFEIAAKLIREGDMEGLAEHAGRFTQEEAEAAAEAARR